ncbi:uncharacterized protein [Muntiacus reevesi]|uniref:uncharacterized protein n=1 Tax=Muntiacus reevesi TaxID=9886 RepID=UPI003306BDEF
MEERAFPENVFGVILLRLILFGTIYTSWTWMPISFRRLVTFPDLGEVICCGRSPVHLSRALSSGLQSCVFSGCCLWGYMGPDVLSRPSGWSDRSGWIPVRGRD